MRKLQILFERWLALLRIFRGRIRARRFALRGATIDGKSYFGAGCRVDRPWCIKVGARFFAEEFTYFKAVENSALIHIGDFVFIGRGTEFDIMQSVSIGDHTVIAPGCFITDHNHGIAPDRRIDEQPCQSEAVRIGRDVWLGTKVVVLAGVAIGDGAVVAANSVVTKNIPAMAVVAGTPAKLLYFRGEEKGKQALEQGGQALTMNRS